MNQSINPHKLYRDSRHAVIAGVCAGLADYFGVSLFLVRFLFVCALLFGSPLAIIVYIVMIFTVPKKPREYKLNQEEEVFWRSVSFKPRETFTDIRHSFRQMEDRMRKMEDYVTSTEFELERKYDAL